MKKAELLVLPQTRTALVVNEANRLHKYAQSQADMAACAGHNAVMAGLKIGKMLTGLKILTPHGGWKELFDGEKDSSKLKPRLQFEGEPNVNHGLHLIFSRQMANRYMRCYTKAKLSLDNKERVLLDTGLDGEPVDALPELVDKATNGAETPRQMMINCGIVVDKRRPTPPKSQGFKASGNPAGRPAIEKEIDPEAELAEARKLATYAKDKLCQGLSEFCDLGRHALLDKDDLAALEIVLRSTLDQVQAARKSAQARPSNPDSLPLADVFAGHGDGLPSIPFPAV